MNYFELLPLDISISILLPYIPPEDFDSFCVLSSRFESWSKNKENLRKYLLFHNISFNSSAPNEGLMWAVRINSKTFIQYFLYLGATAYNRAMTTAARRGNISLVKFMISCGAYDYEWAAANAATAGSLEIVELYSNFNRLASRYSEMLIY